MTQELWVVDLNLSYDDTLAMFRLMEFASQGALDTISHLFDIPLTKKDDKKSKRRRIKEQEKVGI